MLWPPTHTIRTAILFITNIISGIINVIARFTNKFVFVSALFASSKRSSSYFCVPNARITESPVRISRLTRFSLSTWFWISLNFGITTRNKNPTITIITATASPMIHDMSTFVWKTFQIPPIAIIGAYRTIRRIITSNNWICWMSFVLLVISDAVENLSNSALEKPTTLRNTFSRSLRPTPAPTRDASSPTSILAAIPRNASASILAPVCKI